MDGAISILKYKKIITNIVCKICKTIEKSNNVMCFVHDKVLNIVQIPIDNNHISGFFIFNDIYFSIVYLF